MIEIGGEIVANGENPKGEYWHIGIDKPNDEHSPIERELETIIPLCNKAIATSGNYRNYYIQDGQKFAHTIDPRTGYPSQTNILSATVIADDCMSADAFATVFMLTDTTTTRLIAEKENLSYMLILGAKDSAYVIVQNKNFLNLSLKNSN